MNSFGKNTLLLAAMLGWVAVMLAGCAPGPGPVFHDEGSIPSLPTNSIVHSTVAIAGLTPEDETKIELMIFRSMLTQHLWNPNGPTAIFLQADDAEVTKLRGEFPGLIPPIKPTRRIDLSERNDPLDKDTGKPAIILSVEFVGATPSGAIRATGKWYSNSADMGLYSFLASRNGDDWSLQSSQ